MNFQVTEVIIMCRLIQKPESYHELKTFNDMIYDFNEIYKEHIISGFVGTYGDEFQGIVNNFANGFDIILDLKQRLKKYQCRFVLGGIQIVTRDAIRKECSWNLMGYGLAETRKLLNKKNGMLDIYIPEQIHNIQLENTSINDIKNIMKQLDSNWSI